uniref:Uncharacterized protein n=1 Tax=Oryza punctata TaxID=4537 RepID=A0A0E0MFI6_ORYPU
MQMSSGGGGGGNKVMSPKQVLTVVLVVFCALSFIKLLLLTGSSPAAAARRGHGSAWGIGGGGNGTDGLAPKEAALLRSVVAARAPCRLLVFGLSPQLVALSAEAVDVAVHDVHRTVERWYAWEYLCEDNLAATKGRLWHFRVAAGGGPADAFCSISPAEIL